MPTELEELEIELKRTQLKKEQLLLREIEQRQQQGQSRKERRDALVEHVTTTAATAATAGAKQGVSIAKVLLLAVCAGAFFEVLFVISNPFDAKGSAEFLAGYYVPYTLFCVLVVVFIYVMQKRVEKKPVSHSR